MPFPSQKVGWSQRVAGSCENVGAVAGWLEYVLGVRHFFGDSMLRCRDAQLLSTPTIDARGSVSAARCLNSFRVATMSSCWARGKS